MSGSSGSKPKVMSNRLMTMKFMQRASSTNHSPSSPRPSPYNLPSTPNSSSSSKRQKTTHTPTSDSPDTPSYINDTAATRAAIAAEEAQRAAALEKLDVGTGETRWAFSYFDTSGKGKNQNGEDGNKNLKVVGYGEDDSEEEDTEGVKLQPWREEQAGGRMKFGTWKKGKEETSEEEESGNSEDEDEDESDDSLSEAQPDEPDVHAQERAERARRKLAAKKIADKKERDQLAKLRKSKEVNLNGRPRLDAPKGLSNAQACFKCGEVGHISRECSKGGGKKCNKCGIMGHISKDCPAALKGL